MESTVNERIANIISFYGYKSKRAFADKIGVAQTSLNDILKGAEPKYSTLYKILLAEPLVSAEWLLRGTGDMELSSTAEELEDEALSDNYILNVMANALDDLHKFLEIKENKINELEKELESYRKKQVG